MPQSPCSSGYKSDDKRSADDDDMKFGLRKSSTTLKRSCYKTYAGVGEIMPIINENIAVTSLTNATSTTSVQLPVASGSKEDFYCIIESDGVILLW